MKNKVARGAELLDKVRPGWELKIRATKLDMVDPDRCILGQVFGTYYAGKSSLNIAAGDGDKYGFYLPDGESRWGRLRQAWLSLIRKRIRAVGV